MINDSTSRVVIIVQVDFAFWRAGREREEGACVEGLKLGGGGGCGREQRVFTSVNLKSSKRSY